MPTYSYECRKCGTISEYQCPVDDRDNLSIECDSCDNFGKDESFKRILSATQFHLKGSGWSKDGYQGTTKQG